MQSCDDSYAGEVSTQVRKKKHAHLKLEMKLSIVAKQQKGINPRGLEVPVNLMEQAEFQISPSTCKNKK